MIGRPTGRALLLGTVVTLVAAAVGTALLLVDSPARERQHRLDERRVEDLQTIAAAVDAYWSREGELPPDLDALAGWQGLEAPPRDPATDSPFRYRPGGGGAYELCATFVTDSPGTPSRWPRREPAGFWHHPAGDHCFALTARKLAD